MNSKTRKKVQETMMFLMDECYSATELAIECANELDMEDELDKTTSELWDIAADIFRNSRNYQEWYL